MNNQGQKPDTVRDIMKIMDQVAPPEMAAEWDMIGLQIGDPDAIVNRILLTLDADAAAIEKAATSGCQLIICHHPLIFSPLPGIRQDVPEQQLVQNLIINRISLFAAHTNLDAAHGGVADCLADRLGIQFDNRLVVGMYGRLGDLEKPQKLSQLLAMTRKELGSAGCRINIDQDREISRMAVFPGSFAEEDIPLLALFGINTLICGEIKHNVGLQLAARGIAAINAGHDVSERVVLKPLALRLSRLLPQISFDVWEGLDYNNIAF